MEAFEQFVAIAMEAEGFVVSPAVKFDVARRTRKAAYEEIQKHGYEVDLVGANANRLVLATVKSFFGSSGVGSDGVMGVSKNDRQNRMYALLNNVDVRKGVVEGACQRFGYTEDQVSVRLYVGKFAAAKSGAHEKRIKAWCAQQVLGGGPIEVIALGDVIAQVRNAAKSKQYRDNPVLVTMKVLEHAGLLTVALPDDVGSGIDA